MSIFKKNLGLSIVLLAGMVGASGAAWGQADQTATQDMKDAGHETKEAAKDTGQATKKAATKTGHAVKKTTKKTVHATAKGTAKAADKVEDKTAPN
jgi:hypothetical protein